MNGTVHSIRTAGKRRKPRIGLQKGEDMTPKYSHGWQILLMSRMRGGHHVCQWNFSHLIHLYSYRGFGY
jgi:hypothetical protein